MNFFPPHPLHLQSLLGHAEPGLQVRAQYVTLSQVNGPAKSRLDNLPTGWSLWDGLAT